MSPEQNRALVRRFVDEVQSWGNHAAIDEYLAETFTNHSPVPGVPPTRDGVRLLFDAFRSAFPDMHVVIHDQVAEGDRVVTRKTFHGTHHGVFMGIPPTGRPVSFEVIDLVRITDDKITDHWNVVDQLGLLQQLGVIPR